MSGLKSFGSKIFTAKNRPILLLFGALSIVVIGVIVYTLSAMVGDDDKGAATVAATTSNLKTVVAGTGKESEEYLKHVREYNQTTLAEARNENPSAHPIPIFDKELDAQSCDLNREAYTDCLKVSGAIGDGQCAATDTQCMIDKGMIASNECAPGDELCKQRNGLSGKNSCPASDYACIARKALEVGCSTDDTQCLIDKGVIPVSACAPDDLVCKASKRKYCSENDEACIKERAAQAGCSELDSQCLRAAGVIAMTACAPKDIKCRTERNFCSENDIACIASRARLAGCDVDDTKCLRDAGIIELSACAPGDQICRSKSQPFVCAESDINCIKTQAALVGCSPVDSNCLRSKGIIAQTACAPGDTACEQQRVKCSPDDISCIEEKARLAGCRSDDSLCLQRAGIIEEGQCSPGDQACSSKTAQVMAKCDPTDIACIAQAAQKAGCRLSDTDCLISANIIPVGSCAPSDKDCLNVRTANGTRGLIPRSTGDERYVESTKGTVQGRQYGSQSYSDRLADKEYMNEMLQVAGKVISRRPSALSFVVEDRDNVSSTTKSGAQNTDIAKAQSVEQENIEPSVKILAKSGDMSLAVSDLALSTNYQGPVSLTVIGAGALQNLRLLGQMVALEDRVRLELNRCIFPDGVEVPCEAVALDMETSYAAVASDVDNHILYRYGWWGVGTALSAFGKAAELSAKQIVLIDGGGAAESNEMSAEAELKVALGYLGEELGKTFKQRLETPPTITVDINEQLGVFFMKPLTKPEAIK